MKSGPPATITPGSPTLLNTVKQILLEGESLARLGDPFSALKAAIFLDLAVEQMLNAIIFDCDPGSSFYRKDPNWAELWNATEKALTTKGIPSLTKRPELKTLHEVRNLAQHQGSIPSASAISIGALAARSMIETAFRDVYAPLTLASYQLSEAIRNPNLRRLVNEIEVAIRYDDLAMAVAGLRVAFDLVIAATARTHHPEEPDRFSRHFSDRDFVGRGSSSELEALRRAVQKLSERLERSEKRTEEVRNSGIIANLGVSMGDTGRFRALVRCVVVNRTMDETWHIAHVGRLEIEQRGEVEFGRSYLIQLLLLTQEAYAEAIDGIRVGRPLFEQPAWLDRHPEGTDPVEGSK